MDKITQYVIKETRNYSQFKKLLGNRDVSMSRLSAIKESILRIGYQPSPILVNEKFEVIDGQGRLAACAALNLPVFYVMKKGLRIEDCMSMNMKMENWKTADYISSFSQRGVPAYVKLSQDLKEFKGLSWSDLMVIRGGGTGPAVFDALKVGKLQYTNLDYQQRECARWLCCLLPYIRESGLPTTNTKETLARLYRYNLIDSGRMLEAFSNYGAKFGASAPRSKDVLQFINEIYNYNRQKVVFFADDYRRQAMKSAGRNGQDNLKRGA